MPPLKLIIIISILVLLIVTFIVLALCNRWLPKWACTKMRRHLQPKQIGFDGCSAKGTCPRCGEKVLQDSQGNWF